MQGLEDSRGVTRLEGFMAQGLWFRVLGFGFRV